MNPTETDKTTDKTTEPADGGTGATTDAAIGTAPAGTVGNEHDPDSSLEEDLDTPDDAAHTPGTSSGLLSATAAVVAAGLGVVGLSGSWVGRVAAERQTLLGQIKTGQGGSPADQISAIYGDAWHTTALTNGVFALLALIVAAAVLVRPQRAGWVRAFAVAGAVLGGLGLIVSIGMYFDLILALPTAGS